MSTKTNDVNGSEQSTNPASHQSNNPALFNQARILQQIGHRRIAKFLDSFIGDLASLNLVAPLPSVAPPDHHSAPGEGGLAKQGLPSAPLLAKEGPLESMTDDYFSKIAAFLSNTSTLPTRLSDTMRALESAASPENDARLDAIIQRRIPCVSLYGLCALDRALEVWFAASEELHVFKVQSSTVGSNPPLALPPPLPLAQGSGFDGSTVQGSAFDSSSSSLAAPKSDEGGSSISFHASRITEHSTRNTDSQPSTFNLQPSTAPSSDTEIFTALAKLSPADYDRTRKDSARKLGIRVETLDTEVTRLRNQIRDDEAFNSALSTLHSPVPWPEPVNAAEVLTQIVDRFRHYLFLPPGAAEAFTLWSAHAHCFSAFTQSPRLNLSSPEPGCGKTTAFDLIAALTPRALRTENLTAPVLFRLVHQYQPTLLLDEVDAWLPQAEELRGLLNAGHKRGACAYRCDGEGNAVRPFRAFSPAALAGIGALPGTLHDRSVVVRLVKAEAHEVPTARFNDQRADLENELCRKLARWTADNFEALKSCEPQLPATAFNRLADNWRPLFAIAQIAGGPWPRFALESFNHLSNPPLPLRLRPPLRALPSSSLAAPKSPSEGGSSLAHPMGEGSRVRAIQSSGFNGSAVQSCSGSRLVADIRFIFTHSGASCLSTNQLLDALCSLPDRSYCQPSILGRKPRKLARQLAAAGIHPRYVRIAGRVLRGYEFADFAADSPPAP